MSHSYSTRSRSGEQNGCSSSSTTSVTERRVPFRQRSMLADERLQVDEKDCTHRDETTIQEMICEVQPGDQGQGHFTDGFSACGLSSATLILKPTMAIVCFCALAYGTLLLCQHLSALDELTSLKQQVCGLHRSFNRKLDAEIEARKCQEKRQEDDIKKIRVQIQAIEEHMDELTTSVTNTSLDIKSELAHNMSIYNADKNGKPDFALETSGGKIFSTRNTVTYTLQEPTYLLGLIPLCQEYNMASTIINPSVFPGECWAFEGSQGSVVIQLLGRVIITGVTMEHISNLLAPTGDITTAPKDFSIWGLTDPDEQEGFFFGKFHYENNGEPIQYFDTIHQSTRPFNFVELKVHSNHGHPEYTCIYRVRIHGKLESMQ